MKPLLLSTWLLCAAVTASFPAGARAAEPSAPEDLKIGAQITEVGLMRTLLVLTSQASEMQKLVAERLTEVDFRVFPSAKTVSARPSAAEMRQLGLENKADLVLTADVSSRSKNKLGQFEVFEGEATVQIYSPVSGEMLISETKRLNGTRNIDAVEAERDAREKALDLATREAITKGLEKAHKMMVHTATVTGVKDNNQLLIIKDFMAKMEGVYHVRQISFDPQTRVAELEIIGSPKAEEFWRAYLERMPRTRIVVKVQGGSKPRNDYPTWFKGAK